MCSVIWVTVLTVVVRVTSLFTVTGARPWSHGWAMSVASTCPTRARFKALLSSRAPCLPEGSAFCAGVAVTGIGHAGSRLRFRRSFLAKVLVSYLVRVLAQGFMQDLWVTYCCPFSLPQPPDTAPRRHEGPRGQVLCF